MGLHSITILRWIKMGKLAAVRVWIEARIPRSEIERLLGLLLQAASDCEPLLKLVCEDRFAEVFVAERETGSAGSHKSISKRCSPALGWPSPC